MSSTKKHIELQIFLLNKDEKRKVETGKKRKALHKKDNEVRYKQMEFTQAQIYKLNNL